MEYFLVDAFTGDACLGGQSAVCLMPDWPSDTALKRIANEMNTDCATFLVEQPGCYSLRWFSGDGEIFNMKYSLVAAALALSLKDKTAAEFVFETKNGRFTVERDGGQFSLILKAVPVSPYALRNDMVEALGGARPVEVYIGRDPVCIMESEEAVRQLKPDFDKILALPEGVGLFVAAPGERTDIAARAFWPKIHINEDTVCGSMFANLAPLFSKRLHKSELTAVQLSARGGRLLLKTDGDCVRLCGRARLACTRELTPENA